MARISVCKVCGVRYHDHEDDGLCDGCFSEAMREKGQELAKLTEPHEPDYLGASLRALATGTILTASLRNYTAGHACCLCWTTVQEGEQVIAVYEDVWRPAHAACAERAKNDPSSWRGYGFKN